MSEIIVGIDLGTTNSAVAVVQNGEPRLLTRGNQRIIPSVVAYSKPSGWLVGRPALNHYLFDPDNTVRSIKRKMGSSETIMLGGRPFTPQQISAFILRELKTMAEENLGQPVNKAVITVPAYFTNAQRQATKEAGAIAGLEVVRIINEPTAAALAYGLNDDTDQMALVYDLGGGTFDVSLVEMTGGVVEVRASHGDTYLGGDDFDTLLAQRMQELFYAKHSVSLQNQRLALARLRHAAEMAKIQLSNFPEVPLREEYLVDHEGVPLHLDEVMTREQFEVLTADLLARTKVSLQKVLADAQLTVDDLSRVLLVGGATRMPAVWRLAQEFTGLEPDMEINPDEVVALGAAVQAAIIAGQPVDSILVDVTPYSLGIESAALVNGQTIPDIYTVLIHRNTAIPVTKEETFYTLHANQDTVKIKVYQGEAALASANTLLGEFMIKNLKSVRPNENPSVNVRFDFDVNGMLSVKATNRATGSYEGITVEATQASLTLGEIAAARHQLTELHDFAQEELLTEIETPAPLSPPEINAETQALLNRAQALITSGTLTAAQVTKLKTLVQTVQTAPTQDKLDEVSEELLEVLFDLE